MGRDNLTGSAAILSAECNLTGSAAFQAAEGGLTGSAAFQAAESAQAVVFPDAISDAQSHFEEFYGESAEQTERSRRDGVDARLL